jgi:hypothetical protein
VPDFFCIHATIITVLDQSNAEAHFKISEPVSGPEVITNSSNPIQTYIGPSGVVNNVTMLIFRVRVGILYYLDLKTRVSLRVALRRMMASGA